jgi:hypothetical protein
LAESLCEVRVQVTLGDGLIVDNIEEPAQPQVDGMNHRSSCIVAVDLVDPAVSVPFDHCASVEELAKEDASGGAIDSAEAKDEAAEGEDVRFSFEEEFSRFGRRLCGRVFGDGFSIGLCEDGGAAGVGEQFWNKESVEVFCAVQVDVPVSIRSTFSGARAVDEGIGTDEVTEVRVDLVRV